MARPELLKDPQFKEVISELRANAKNIDRDMQVDFNETIIPERERLDQKIIEGGRPVIVFVKPAPLRKAA